LTSAVYCFRRLALCVLQAKKAADKDEEVLVQLMEKSAVRIQAHFRGRKQAQVAKATMGFFRYQKAMEVWPDMDRLVL
jgi:hypothetical protein